MNDFQIWLLTTLNGSPNRYIDISYYISYWLINNPKCLKSEIQDWIVELCNNEYVSDMPAIWGTGDRTPQLKITDKGRIYLSSLPEPVPLRGWRAAIKTVISAGTGIYQWLIRNFKYWSNNALIAGLIVLFLTIVITVILHYRHLM